MNNVKIIGVSDKRLQKGLYWERAWSLIQGCTKVSEGCENCWAERQHKKFFSEIKSINWEGKIRIIEHNLDLPLKIKKPTVFAIWNDLFHEDVPFEFIEKVFGIMGTVRYHTFLVLTKRPERMLKFCKWQTDMTGEGYLNEGNVWFGATVEMNKYRWRIDELLKIPNVKRFVSIEPMLEDIDVSNICIVTGEGDIRPFADIDWVIVGAESGSNRRECRTEWVRNIVEQCKTAGVPVFVKQIHHWTHPTWGVDEYRIEKNINKFPEDLRIRQLPF